MASKLPIKPKSKVVSVDPLKEKVRTVFFSNTALPPSVKRVDMGRALAVGGAIGFAITTASFLAADYVLNNHFGFGDGLKSTVQYWEGLKSAYSYLNPHGEEMRYRYLEYLGQTNFLKKLQIASEWIVSGLAGYAAGKWASRGYLIPTDGYLHVSGPVLLTDSKKGLEEAQHYSAEEGGYDPSQFCAYLHPELPICLDRFTKHMVIVGKVGSGKTVAIGPMIEQAIEHNYKMWIHDIKGDYLEKYHHERKRKDGKYEAHPTNRVWIMSPFDDRSLVWDISRDIIDEATAKAFVESLIPVSESDPMWGNMARMIATACILKLLTERGSGKWGVADLCALLETDKMSIQTIVNQYYPDGDKAANTADVTLDGIITNMMSGTAILFSMALAWSHYDPNAKNLFSIREWVINKKYNKRIVTFSGDDKFGELSAKVANVFVSIAASYILSQECPDNKRGDPDPRRLFFLLDEFPAMGKVDRIPKLGAVGRSKGVCLILIVQDLNQLYQIYGQEVGKTMISISGTHIVMGTGGGVTAQELSDFIGKRKVERRNETYAQGQGASGSFNVEEQVLVTPELLQNYGLVPGQGVRGLVKGIGPNVLTLFWTFSKYPYKNARLGVYARWAREGSAMFNTEMRNKRRSDMIAHEDWIKENAVKMKEDIVKFNLTDPAEVKNVPAIKERLDQARKTVRELLDNKIDSDAWKSKYMAARHELSEVETYIYNLEYAVISDKNQRMANARKELQDRIEMDKAEHELRMEEEAEERAAQAKIRVKGDDYMARSSSKTPTKKPVSTFDVNAEAFSPSDPKNIAQSHAERMEWLAVRKQKLAERRENASMEHDHNNDAEEGVYKGLPEDDDDDDSGTPDTPRTIALNNELPDYSETDLHTVENQITEAESRGDKASVDMLHARKRAVQIALKKKGIAVKPTPKRMIQTPNTVLRSYVPDPNAPVIRGEGGDSEAAEVFGEHASNQMITSGFSMFIGVDLAHIVAEAVHISSQFDEATPSRVPEGMKEKLTIIHNPPREG